MCLLLREPTSVPRQGSPTHCQVLARDRRQRDYLATQQPLLRVIHGRRLLWSLEPQDSHERHHDVKVTNQIRDQLCRMPTHSFRLQTETALSTTKSEYMTLSENVRTLLPIMDLLKEGVKNGVPVHTTQPTVRCKIFEDNAGALELANVPKVRPHTCHINQKYHNFRAHVRSGRLKVLPIETKNRLANQFNKGLLIGLFQDLQK
jgi:hypothetical protein